jgi:hypothetical protein
MISSAWVGWVMPPTAAVAMPASRRMRSAKGAYQITMRRVQLQPLTACPAISQGGLDLWFEQAPDFLAARQRCV